MSTTNNVKARLRIARKTEAEWTSSNPVGLDGEWMVTSDASTAKIKIGDGTSTWSELEYVDFGGDGGGDYLPLSGGTLTGDLVVDSTKTITVGTGGAYIYSGVSDPFYGVHIKYDGECGYVVFRPQNDGNGGSEWCTPIGIIFDNYTEDGLGEIALQGAAGSGMPIRLTGVDTPTTVFDAANKAYVDGKVTTTALTDSLFTVVSIID